MIIGTAAYMAPEQAKGKAVDKRADIWAFGVVLYEMLTGRALFEGETVSEVLASVIMRDPDLTALPSSVPAPVQTCDRPLPRQGSEAPAQGHRRSASRACGIGARARAGRGASSRAFTDGQSQARRPSSPPDLRWRSSATGAVLWRVATTSVGRRPDRSLRRAAAGQDIARARGTARRRAVAGRIDDGRSSRPPRGSRDCTSDRSATSRLRALPGTEGGSNPVFSPTARRSRSSPPDGSRRPRSTARSRRSPKPAATVTLAVSRGSRTAHWCTPRWPPGRFFRCRQPEARRAPLTTLDDEDWRAHASLAVRPARRQGRPLHGRDARQPGQLRRGDDRGRRSGDRQASHGPQGCQLSPLCRHWTSPVRA